MDVGDILEKLEGDQEAIKLLPLIQPYLTVLSREEGKDKVDKFMNLFIKQEWQDLDSWLWPKMTDDERDALSAQVLDAARKTVDNLHLSDKIMKKVALKILMLALKI